MGRTAVPETRYARSGGGSVAFQVVGDGPLDVVFVWGVISHIELAWEVPECARFLDRLAGIGRLIHFDKRGTGLSDPVQGALTLEQRMDDVRAVMDAAGCERAVLVGVSEGSAMTALFAATYPERVSHLVLFGSYARIYEQEPGDGGLPREVVDRTMDRLAERWGRPAMAPLIAPSRMGDEAFLRSFARFERASCAPGMFRALMALNLSFDIRPLLSTIAVPTLVLHRDEKFVPLRLARELADGIPGARFVQLPGQDHLFFQDPDQVPDQIEELVTGAPPASEPEPDRVLATVLFTDIVGSTERAVALGDARWRALLEQHDAMVRRELQRFRGREVKAVGDGFLATFDGPARAIRCARAIAEAARGLGLEVRAGLHTGECDVRGDDIGGIAVHVGARVAALAEPGEVLVSRTVRDLVFGSGLDLAERGSHALKGVPGAWDLYAAA